MRSVFILIISALAAASAVAAEQFTCPPTLETDQTSGGMPQSFKFRYVSFYDGDPGENVDLAPDEGPDPIKLKQRWQFTRTPGRPIVMVCRYHGTTQTIRKEVPPWVKECRLEGLVTDQGEIVGSPILECR